MTSTNLTLAEQLQLHDLEINKRKELLGFTHEDVYNLTKLRARADLDVDKLVDAFYAKQLKYEEIAVIIGDADTLVHLKSAQTRYILDLFSGEYDSAYVNNRLRIGMVHKRIGVEPKYYLSAMLHLKELLMEWVRDIYPRSEDSLAIRASLDKLLVFDTQLVFDTYIRSLLSEIEVSKHQVENYAESLEHIVHERTKQLEELSQRDHLTGLFNRRALDVFAQRFLANAERHSMPVSLLYFDVDSFKEINDSLGHAEGDRILTDLGGVLVKVTRQGDIPCRMGGDEFCILMLNSSCKDAQKLAARLMHEVDLIWEGRHSISIGSVTVEPDRYLAFSEILGHADQAMYEAKNINGNSFVDYNQLGREPSKLTLLKDK